VLHYAREKTIAALLTETTYYAYKPVYFLSVKLDVALHEEGAGLAHVVNLLLFALAAFLLVGLLHDLLGSLWLAGAAGLLFAVHPVHVESVAWLSGRKDVLSLVFVLLAHRAYRRRRANASEGAAGLSFGAAALLLLAGLTKGTVWTWVGVLAPAATRAPVRSCACCPAWSWASPASRSTPGSARTRGPARWTTASRRSR
jgi:hypothetical protein